MMLYVLTHERGTVNVEGVFESIEMAKEAGDKANADYYAHPSTINWSETGYGAYGGSWEIESFELVEKENKNDNSPAVVPAPAEGG